jgi:hypothetical protein
VFTDPTAHFVHLTIEGDELRAHAIDGTGQEFDTFSIRRPGAEAPPAVATQR